MILVIMFTKFYMILVIMFTKFIGNLVISASAGALRRA